MRFPTFDPNRDMIPISHSDPAVQASFLDRMVFDLCGPGAFVDSAAILTIGEATDRYPLGRVTVHLSKSCSGIQALMPEGSWGIMVLAGTQISEGLTDNGVASVSHLQMLGKIPPELTKIVCVVSEDTRCWLGGLHALNEHSIVLVNDFLGTFTEERYDPEAVSASLVNSAGLVKKVRPRYDEYVLPDEIVSALSDDLAYDIEMFAVQNALRSSCQNVSRATLALISNATISALSCGYITELFDPDRGNNAQGKLPVPFNFSLNRLPDHHPYAKYLEAGKRMALLIRAWNAYLSGYGLSLALDKIPSAEILDTIITPEFEKIVKRICKDDYTDEDSDYMVLKAATLSPGKEKTTLFLEKQLVEGTSYGWAIWPPKTKRGQVGGKAYAGITKASLAMWQAEAMLATEIAKLGELQPIDRQYSIRFLKVNNGYDCQSLNSADAMLMAKCAPNGKWGFVTCSETEPLDALGFLICAVTSGLWRQSDCEVMACIGCDMDSIEQETLNRIFNVLKDGGWTHIADCNGRFGVADLSPYVTKDNKSRMRYSMKSKDVVDQEILHELSEVGEIYSKSIFPRHIQKLVRCRPERYVEMVKLLSDSHMILNIDSIAVSKYDEDNTEKAYKCHIIIDVLSPIDDFFEFDEKNVEAILDSLRICAIWKAVLGEHGMALSPNFPLGVNKTLFDKVREAIGVDSYLEAFEAGIPIEDVLVDLKDLFPDIRI